MKHVCLQYTTLSTVLGDSKLLGIHMLAPVHVISDMIVHVHVHVHVSVAPWPLNNEIVGFS